MSDSPFDLVHCDIWGPYHVPSHDNKRYFLTLVDDHTRFTWIYMLQYKSEAKTYIQQFFALVETQFHITTKQFRSDNAKELSLTDFLSEKGTLHQYSCVERPQQNSVVERKHQHLLNVARAIYFQSRVPIVFWGECLKTVVFLINRTPTPLLQGKTPYQLLFKKVPEYSALKVFGCLAFAFTLPSKRDKFTPRAVPTVFMGYPIGYKGYKLYDLTTKQFIISRDMVFHETTFPFQIFQTLV